ncbi:hypothetical protein ACIOWI_29795 [Streptomyces sp. NPDC087659]|uniref:hypothetical protein n=1 Tax=Streptomyces sp. NPDC087659 TaxID=3365801 RepID=UPI0038081487
MARVRYLGPEPVTVPELGGRTVHPDETVTVPDERFGAYVCQTTNWESVEEPKDWTPPAPEREREPESETATPARTAAKKTVAKKTTDTPQKEG